MRWLPHFLTTVIAGNFDRTSNDGPGGWWILDEPECHLDSDVVVPNITSLAPDNHA